MLKQFEFRHKVTLVEHIYNGCEISCHLAINYTKSNGPADDEESLHYIQPGTKNQYTEMMTEILKVLLDYNHSNKIGVYGFGGTYPGITDNATSDCFAINGNIFAPRIKGLSSLIEAYRRSLT